MRYAQAMGAGHEGASDLVTKFWPLITGTAIAAWTLFREWASGRRRRARESAATISQRGELIVIAQDAAKGVIGILTEENRRLALRVDELEDEIKKFQVETSASLRSKDAEIILLRGQLRQALSFVTAYDKLLTDKNIAHNAPSNNFWRLAEGQVASLDTGVEYDRND